MTNYRETLAYYIANPFDGFKKTMFGTIVGANGRHYMWRVVVDELGVQETVWDNTVPKYTELDMMSLIRRDVAPTAILTRRNERWVRGHLPEEVMPLIGILPWESKDSAK